MISLRVVKILWGRAGALCSYPGCRKPLVAEAQQGTDAEAILGEIAHIVAQEKDGPRGDKIPPGGFIDGYQNLILLCRHDHRRVDEQPQSFPVEKLVQLRIDHERWVTETLSREQRFQGIGSSAVTVREELSSTLLPVGRMPRSVWSAPCTLAETTIARAFVFPQGSDLMYPFIVREGRLISFCDLEEGDGPFSEFIDQHDIARHDVLVSWRDADKGRWLVTLLNRCLNKLTGRRGLRLDKVHGRYYFEPLADGRTRSVAYKSLQGHPSERMVAWQPRFKKTGQPKQYWEHLAVGLHFHQVGEATWCLSIRPERRFTLDGYHILTPRGTGRRATRRKARMYNLNVLEEVHFWRAHLSQGAPRIIFKFGSQNMIVDSSLLRTSVEWPGVSLDERLVKPVDFDDDLFTRQEYQDVLRMEEEGGGAA